MVKKLSEDELKDLAKEVIGDELYPLVILLQGRKNVSEVKLAEKLKISVNNIRTLLYRLNSFNLVHSKRKKDKKKGWYIYYWTFDSVEARNLLYNSKKKRLDYLKKKIKNEAGSEFFICPNKDGVRLGFESAMEQGFKCHECGSLLERDDNAKLLKKIEKEIKDLEIELKEEEDRKKRDEELAIKREESKIKRARAKSRAKRASKKKGSSKKQTRKSIRKKTSTKRKAKSKPRTKKPPSKKATKRAIKKRKTSSKKSKIVSKRKSSQKLRAKRKIVKRPSLLKKIIKRKK